MKQWHMIFDVDRCTNCRNCFISVLDEYEGNEHKGYSKPIKRNGMHLLDIQTCEQGEVPDLNVTYVPVTCNNCDDAPCVKASKDGTVYKRDDGIVLIDPEKSKGQKNIVKTCPYGHIHWNDEEDVPQLWIFDAHLLDNGWKQPRMVDACPTFAIEATKCTPEEMSARVKRENLKALHPEFETQPKIYYKNLDRIFTNFVIGSVLETKSGQTDVFEGVEVVLEAGAQEIQRTRTDYFGEFKFTGLSRDESTFTVKVQPVGRELQSREVTLKISGRISPFIYSND